MSVHIFVLVSISYAEAPRGVVSTASNVVDLDAVAPLAVTVSEA